MKLKDLGPVFVSAAKTSAVVMFLAAAVLLCFVVNESLAERAALHDLMLKLLLVLVGVSVAYSALLCLAPETGWYSDVYPWAYQGLLDAVVFWR